MAEIRPAAAESFLRSPDPKVTAFLLYGSDTGMVTERATRLAQTLARRDNGDIVRIDDADLDNDPDRLSVELLTQSMFGGRKIVRVATGRRVTAHVLKPYVTDPGLAGILIVEGGSYRKGEGVRGLFDTAPAAASIGCYGDEVRDLSAIVDAFLNEQGLSITLEARQILLSRLGADRILSRGELEKLALYVHGQTEVTADDVVAAVGDAAEQTIDRIIQAAARGDSARAVIELSRALAAGETGQSIIALTQYHFLRLHRLRSIVDSGRAVEAAVKDLRPPVHFKVADALQSQCLIWRAGMLDQAVAGIATAARTARTSSALQDSIAERLILSLARLAQGATRSAAAH